MGRGGSSTERHGWRWLFLAGRAGGQEGEETVNAERTLVSGQVATLWVVLGVNCDGEEYLWRAYTDRDAAEGQLRYYASLGWRLREFAAKGTAP